jgi:hypothetical protein
MSIASTVAALASVYRDQQEEIAAIKAPAGIV